MNTYTFRAYGYSGNVLGNIFIESKNTPSHSEIIAECGRAFGKNKTESYQLVTIK